MFGGLAFLLNGKMCCGVVKDLLMLRLGEEGAAEALTKPHARFLDFTGKPMKSMGARLHTSRRCLQRIDPLKETSAVNRWRDSEPPREIGLAAGELIEDLPVAAPRGARSARRRATSGSSTTSRSRVNRSQIRASIMAPNSSRSIFVQGSRPRTICAFRL